MSRLGSNHMQVGLYYVCMLWLLKGAFMSEAGEVDAEEKRLR